MLLDCFTGTAGAVIEFAEIYCRIFFNLQQIPLKFVREKRPELPQTGTNKCKYSKQRKLQQYGRGDIYWYRWCSWHRV